MISDQYYPLTVHAPANDSCTAMSEEPEYLSCRCSLKWVFGQQDYVVKTLHDALRIVILIE